jgi:hypothetical protein
MMLLALLACTPDQGFAELKLDALAVVLGDFDNVGDTLLGMNVPTQEFEGFIVQATYEPDEERTQRGEGATTVEGLLGVTTDGNLQVSVFNGVFVNSGTRGLGAYQYNNALQADNSLLLDTESMDHACNFVTGGGTLVVSDWAYEMIEYCWPDAVEFYGDDLVPDAAQVGIADDVLADVKDEALAEALGTNVNLAYNYTAWTVIEGVGADTEVLLTGDLEYQPSADQLPVELDGAPLMVRFRPGRGQVVYTTFHWAIQNPSVTEALLLQSVEGLAGAVEDDSDTTDTEASGA